MAQQGKKYKNALKLVDRTKNYSLEEAVSVVKKTSYSKFDGTLDVSVNLGVDPKQADQNVRGAVSLPSGTGKKSRIIVFAKGEKALEATKLGADEVGGQELADKILSGWLEFDKVVATPDMMALVGKLGKVLGPRGLMPSPKVGTVTFGVKEILTQLQAGRVEFRVDKGGVVHSVAGKTNMSDEDLCKNVHAIMEAIMKAKPSSSKGIYLKKVSLSATMGPGVHMNMSAWR